MSSSASQGWICLHRQIKSHWLWPDVKGRRYSKFEAWIYLILSANHQARKVDIGSKFIVVERGQLLTSQVALAKKWKWHRETVLQFLYQLKADEMLGIETSNHTSTGYTLLTICNYDKYQNIEGRASDIQSDIQSSTQPTSNRHPTDTNNNGNNKNNKNTRISASITNSGNGASELNLEESFEVFYKAYPKKRSKGQAEKTWKKIKPTPELFKTILDAIAHAKRSEQWRKNNGQYIPHPSTWLNAKGWE